MGLVLGSSVSVKLGMALGTADFCVASKDRNMNLR